jgi:hypothetical protein
VAGCRRRASQGRRGGRPRLTLGWRLVASADSRKGTPRWRDEAVLATSGSQGMAVAIRSCGDAEGSEEQRRDGERGNGDENCEAKRDLAFDGVRCRGKGRKAVHVGGGRNYGRGMELLPVETGAEAVVSRR